MALFLVRSALCIGLVAAVASGLTADAGGKRLAEGVDRGARDAAARAGRACFASSACLRAGAAALASLPDSPAPPTQAARGDRAVSRGQPKTPARPGRTGAAPAGSRYRVDPAQ